MKRMKEPSGKSSPAIEEVVQVCVDADPGICGFNCRVEVKKTDRRKVTITIRGSECKQIQKLAMALGELTLKELFMPLTRNPIYVEAERAGCHTSCIIPAAVLKAAEAAMGMALPKEVRIRFEPCSRKK
ncbi:MAG: hypothetical protein AB1659_01885 [Thermodesulfobacteriota bacterium]